MSFCLMQENKTKQRLSILIEYSEFFNPVNNFTIIQQYTCFKFMSIKYCVPRRRIYMKLLFDIFFLFTIKYIYSYMMWHGSCYKGKRNTTQFFFKR